MSEEKIKKIIISDEVAEKINQEFIENLQKKENIELVVVSVGVIHEQKMLQHIAPKGSCVIVSVPKEETADLTKAQNVLCKAIMERENETEEMAEKLKAGFEEILKQEELMKNVKIPEVEAYTPPAEEYNKPKKKYNIPRTIGKPNSTRKGGR